MDTFKIINSEDSGLALNLLYLDDLELDTFQKILLVRHWTLLGKPEAFESRLIACLGLDWETYMNPFLIKLYDVDLLHLIVDSSSYESLQDSRYLPIVKSIFVKKLRDLEKKVTRTEYKSTLDEVKYNELTKSIILSISTVDKKYELLRLSLTKKGYSFTPELSLFNRPDPCTDLLTELSVRNLQGLMYQMTEDENWDTSHMPKAIKYLGFKTPILHQLIRAIFDTYYDDEFENRFIKPQDIDDSLKGLFNDDEDEEEIF